MEPVLITSYASYIMHFCAFLTFVSARWSKGMYHVFSTQGWIQGRATTVKRCIHFGQSDQLWVTKQLIVWSIQIMVIETCQLSYCRGQGARIYYNRVFPLFFYFS